jgi:aerobic-type carbon monoxide dehydrogenase small subunit (CoxS/CutS family)
MSVDIEFTINGRCENLSVEPLETLLTVVRDRLGLTGTKKGCDGGECGACTVLLDGEPVLSCLTPAVTAHGRSVTTIEGLATNGHLHRIQAAFIEKGAVQCGFCSPGMIMATAGILAKNPHPNETEIRQGLAGNLCRCTGYQKIVDAVLWASTDQKQGKEGGTNE